MDALGKARALALLTPAALLGGALGSQYLGGLHPCEMCYWQRWPHWAALALALLAIALRKSAAGFLLLALAGLAIFVSGAIGVFHAGVEYGWWEGLTSCSTTLSGGSTEDILNSIMATPVVRCDQAQWTLGGISLAGFNAIFSIGAAIAIWMLMAKARKQ
ncbi:disulfide bond formation protein B [Sphingomonas sp. LaA6.9]|uniref:disulfide bond formation protein B n=1 Tax=Sphingomonas sp. LaA6.9 TaxID=2919914 RepID=UPI001F4FF94B|nr:disulfide bond formation protein B [Sphingomonas sp. LaA6.9]MCJ8156833.1 disulfide bond formation protein B [Sphingomonas sp. LaA6.9]